jgi:hypothetical protein
MKLQKMNYFNGSGKVVCAVDLFSSGAKFTICGNNCIDAGSSEDDQLEIIGGKFRGELKQVTCPKCRRIIEQSSKNANSQNANLVIEINRDLYQKISIIRGKRKIGINAFAKEILVDVVNTAVFYLEGRDNKNKEYFFNKGILTWREIKP